MTDCERVGADPQGAPSAVYSYLIGGTAPTALQTMTFTVVSASHADMENLPDYDLTNEGTFPTRAEAETSAAALDAEQGHTYAFWVLTAAELAA